MHFMKLAAIAALFALPFAGGVQAAPVAIECGPLIKSVVKTDIEFFTTSSELPVPLKGAAVSFSVPAGRTVCVRVRFSAIANCPLSCFLRAFVDNTQMNPAAFSNPMRFSTDNTNGGTAHSFEWVLRVGPGRHTARLTIGRGNTIDSANIGPWTFATDIHE